MCVAIPGRVLSINGTRAQVDFKGNVVSVNIGIVDPKVDDYVLVHAGCAIEVMNKARADELIQLFEELDELDDIKEIG
ncbi:MAG: HypC/HybG/HupF family hydrogenase formation chaperone [Firmicutes bacterium]|jgi:hydrogenase expression/formation protein HypC|nr:HypC/HybG/HupF family hydrogenase formation chaperone [Bacillota bacterium]